MKRSDFGRILRGGNALPDSNLRMVCRLLRVFGGATMTLLFIWLLQQRLAALDLAEVTLAFSEVPTGSWIKAVLATTISFWAVGQYDASLHRHLNTGLPQQQTRCAGMAAIALGQTLGLGLLTGALVRWRMLPSLSLAQATKLSAAVALSFLFGWSMVTALVLMILPDAPFKAAASLLCLVGLGVAALCIIPARPKLFGRSLALPNLFTLWQILAFSLIDTVAAAYALWLMCPPDLALPFATLLPAYLLALSAGLLSGTLGGVGTFEVALLAALPIVPEAGLIAAVLAFRLTYYALPAVLAAVFALRPQKTCRPTQPPAVPTLYANAPAEVGLTAQNQLRVIQLGPKTQGLIGETRHCVTLLLDPFGQHINGENLRALHGLAQSRARTPCLYKCGARLAATARAAGWAVAPIAAEAWLDPTRFTLARPDTSALRRKLRKAKTAGIDIRKLALSDSHDMEQVNRDWVAQNGGERGFSMGRFGSAYVLNQKAFGAFFQGRLCAFVSFHHSANAWTLDLIRSQPACPDGSIYALIAYAIQAAAAEGVTRFSLAAAPRLPDLGTWLGRQMPTGLCQFKSSFAPTWQSLYIAAPNPAALSLATAELYREIHAPAPLGCDDTHNHDEQNKIASHAQPWQMKGNHACPETGRPPSL
jgi:phosphatidylglycerol lysyltransferase